MTSAQQREDFLRQLNEQEDWLYGDGEAADTAELKCGVAGLRQEGWAGATRVAPAVVHPIPRP